MVDSTRPRQRVYLLHGIGAPAWLMLPLARRLATAGYDVTNWGYRSVLGTIEEHGERLAATLASLEPDAELHIVAHSMGSIVTRAALAKRLPPQLRRIVFLGPPHRGTPVASFFGPWLKPLCRLVDQLAAREDSFVNRLAALEGVEFGVIAASRDLLVPIACTHLPGERDHIVVRSLHSELLFREDVARLTCNFLSEGTFGVRGGPSADA